ncbi:probable transmembrane ascorbate ferrireductase 2 [Tetranychus urticae]|uniref:Cytochrome b561 domain-containing protein n=1 Tax=Tetranychus urticae TaxID=32264 RepID=T1JSM2_TETUR|nr:probable transmembrane ascorbate ferrireductase 2 [Tetranychus urticae]
MEGPSTSTSSGGRFFFGVLFTISELLLFGSVSLFVYWVIWHDTGFAWSKNRNEQFNLHAILMIIGFVFLNGQAMLVYKLLHRCRKIYVKIIHCIIFVCSISAITIGMVAGIQAQHNMAPGATIRHFYSLHSWVGLVAIGLFALQFVAGFVSFLILLCCDKATANFRARLLPTHVTFGLIIYSLAVIASISGLLQVARSRLSGKEGKPNYKEFEEPTIIINAVGCCLIGLAILLPYIIRNCGQRSRHSPNFHISH